MAGFADRMAGFADRMSTTLRSIRVGRRIKYGRVEDQMGAAIIRHDAVDSRSDIPNRLFPSDGCVRVLHFRQLC